MSKRYINRDLVLGVDGEGIFNLKKGQEIEVLGIDVYGRIEIRVLGQTAHVFSVMLDSISS